MMPTRNLDNYRSQIIYTLIDDLTTQTLVTSER